MIDIQNRNNMDVVGVEKRKIKNRFGSRDIWRHEQSHESILGLGVWMKSSKPDVNFSVRQSTQMSSSSVVKTIYINKMAWCRTEEEVALIEIGIFDSKATFRTQNNQWEQNVRDEYNYVSPGLSSKSAFKKLFFCYAFSSSICGSKIFVQDIFQDHRQEQFILFSLAIL